MTTSSGRSTGCRPNRPPSSSQVARPTARAHVVDRVPQVVVKAVEPYGLACRPTTLVARLARQVLVIVRGDVPRFAPLHRRTHGRNETGAGVGLTYTGLVVDEPPIYAELRQHFFERPNRSVLPLGQPLVFHLKRCHALPEILQFFLELTIQRWREGPIRRRGVIRGHDVTIARALATLDRSHPRERWHSHHSPWRNGRVYSGVRIVTCNGGVARRGGWSLGPRVSNSVVLRGADGCRPECEV